MRDLFILAIHLLVTAAKLLRPGGVRAVAAASLLLKHPLLISNRFRHRAPNLTNLDRFVLGLATLFVSPRRIPKLGALVKPATLFKFHKVRVDRKYRLLFSSRDRRRRPGPKGPSAELIAAIVELKRRNPRFTPGSAVYASPSSSPTPSASTSIKMSCVACSQSTTDPATPVTWVHLG